MYAIQKYVLGMMREKGIRKSELVKRSGYANISKGCARFDGFINENKYNKQIVDNLHLSLEVSKEEVENKFKETRIEIQQDIEKEKDRERKNFVPFLFCHTERRIPSPIFVCAIMGSDRLKILKLPLDFNSRNPQEQEKIRKKLIAELLKRIGGSIPAFGKITRFTLKRVYDDIEEKREVYNLKGNLMLDPPKEYKEINIGHATLTVKGQDITHLFHNM